VPPSFTLHVSLVTSLVSTDPSRSIRSYVLRQGRITDAQRAAAGRLLPRYGVAYRPEPLDFVRLFGRSAPVVLEIGFGMGETTAAIAAANPGTDYLGVEVHSPGVGSLLRQLEARSLENVRIVQHDAAEVVEHMIAPASLSGIHVFFPDPWPKKRHHKRRLLQAPFARLLATRLEPGGYLHVATDWDDYADAILEALEQSGLVNAAERFATRPAYRPQTKFERRGIRLGHPVRDIVYRRPG
jgi:tRNA (guanine-N7-)-methyltransferase